ncbi:sugar transferase [Blastococcus sp. CT_GayMR20]|uniref:sugar transferase n=1 Tax=Blastococcus sp. CT_GayMR20 TaxID=2559609 RepID=UPI001073B5CD|nr:sugar transferase [Blastococcus sp. CT_GayMR20]TFV92744.1 sugar transferase [Blastococcus sp. CT_GayMR20]TFV92747.1 sugar transferase [Blastococcus sp. CT_GayMR20]
MSPCPSAYLPVKRVIDLVVASVGLLIGAPVMAAIAVAVRRDVGSPVLFRQERPGRNGEPFQLVKFRTMREPRGIESDVERMTPLGRTLRSTSLDELPTLWNVFRGEMSLVGPRPLLMRYLERYSPTQMRRHEVRPGITGLAQVRGRNALTWEEKFAADVEYVERLSLRLDLQILGATISAVLTRHGISASDTETMPEFAGQGAAMESTRKHPTIRSLEKDA